MRVGVVLGISMVAAAFCNIGAAEARRDTTIFRVGAAVPWPGCVASVAFSGIPTVACSGAVVFVVRTVRVWPAATNDLAEPGPASPDAFRVTVTY